MLYGHGNDIYRYGKRIKPLITRSYEVQLK